MWELLTNAHLFEWINKKIERFAHSLAIVMMRDGQMKVLIIVVNEIVN